jgi:ATP-dependent DNA helicase PIF1
MVNPKSKRTGIELNDKFKQALEIMENSNRNVFITGRAGTGKSTLLQYFRLTTKKKVAVLAPTGVAALNVKGQTIHSFFKFKPNITLKLIKKLRATEDEENTIYQRLDAIIIDEISMVRADLLDCVDKFLRLNGPDVEKPFGGIQMIFIGDLYQLPPVITGAEKAGFKLLYKTPYFYSARVFDSLQIELLELDKIYRQHDPDFINLLNTIRNKSVTPEGLDYLNRRYLPEFVPPAGEFYVYLTTTNELASRINSDQLKHLKGRLHTFTGVIEGDFGKEYLPTSLELQLKIGAQIMLLNNDSDGRWVNGTIGEITGISHDGEGERVITAQLEDEEVEITPFTWEIYNFKVEGGQVQSEIVGTFTQYPLMLAWAITIHKSQGKTFDRVVIDIGRGTFAHGQMYVALSRCTSLKGIVLKQPIQKKHIWIDFQVMNYLTQSQYKKAEMTLSLDDKVHMIEKAISERGTLEILYLKPNDEKSRRQVRPLTLEEMEFKGKSYLGLRAFCLTRNAERTFRVDRILEIRRE